MRSLPVPSGSAEGPVVASYARHYGLSSAATPGSSMPARNSSEAPPPVEMWLILSATPADLMAFSESPPPTTLIAPGSGHGFRQRHRAAIERRHLEHAHRPVPDDRFRARDHVRILGDGLGSDVETHHPVRNPLHHLALRARLHLRRRPRGPRAASACRRLRPSARAPDRSCRLPPATFRWIRRARAETCRPSRRRSCSRSTTFIRF